MARGKISMARLLFYLVYAVLVTFVLLIVRFPAENFLQFAEKKLEASFPGSRVKLTSLSYAFPVSGQLGRAQISSIEDEQDLLLLQDVRVTPEPRGLGRSFRFSGSVLGGNFTTGLRIGQAPERFSLNQVELNGVDISRSAYLLRLFRRELQGTLAFKGECPVLFEGIAGDGQGMECKGILGITDGSFALRQPVLTLEKLDFSSLDVSLSTEGGVMSVSKGELAGPELQADFAGTLNVASDPESWQLDLAGTMVPSQELLQEKPQLAGMVNRLQRQYKKEELPYIIGGTLTNPRFRFGEKN